MVAHSQDLAVLKGLSKTGSALALVLALGACSFVPDWANPGEWFEDDPQPQQLSEEAQVDEDAEYPNLASVPNERPEPSMTTAEREALIQQMQTQNAQVNAQSSGPPLLPTRAADIQTPNAPPVPSQVPAPTQTQQSLATQQASASAEPVDTSNLTPTQRVAQMAEARANAETQLAQAQQQQVQQQAAAAQSQTAGNASSAYYYEQAGLNTVQIAQNNSTQIAQNQPVYAGQTPPGMVEPMAYNSGNYGLGTTVVGSGGQQYYAGQGTNYGAGGYANAANLAGVIYFGHNSAGLSGNDQQVLRDIANAWRNTGGVLTVVGHASQQTATMSAERHAEVNYAVSEARARQVAAALQSLGVSAGAMVVEAYGASQPVYGEFMPTGEAHNRRVEIYLN